MLNDIHSRRRVRIDTSPNTDELRIIAPKHAAEDTAQEVEAVLSAVVVEPLALSGFYHWLEKWDPDGFKRFDLQIIKQALGSSRVTVTGPTGSKRFGKVSNVCEI